MKRLFGKIESENAYLYELTNGKNTRVKISDYGAVIVAIETEDRRGEIGDVVLGYDTLDEYLRDEHYIGAAVCPCCGRVSGASFVMDGKEYLLDKNKGDVHLHGGYAGFSRRLWKAVEWSPSSVVLYLRHTHLESGYPGNIDVWLTYELGEDNTLSAKSKAISDRKAIFNITYHPYFNLGAPKTDSILEHELTINGKYILDINEELFPTGKLIPVAGTPFDFTSPKAIGKNIGDDHPLLRYAGGYDHAWVLDTSNAMDTAASVYEAYSGRKLSIRTDMPTLVFYTGNFLDNTRGKGGQTYRPRSGFCLEPQYFTDAPNHSEFPSIIIEPHAIYESETRYTFSVEK